MIVGLSEAVIGSMPRPPLNPISLPPVAPPRRASAPPPSPLLTPELGPAPSVPGTLDSAQSGARRRLLTILMPRPTDVSRITTINAQTRCGLNGNLAICALLRNGGKAL